MKALLIFIVCCLVGCNSEFSTGEGVAGMSASAGFSSDSATIEVAGNAANGGATSVGTSELTVGGSTVIETTTVSASGATATLATIPETGGSSGASSRLIAAGAPSSVARIVYRGSSPPTTSSSIQTTIELFNITESDWNLAEYRLRYWFTGELPAGVTLTAETESGSLASEQVSIGTVLPVRSGADHYVEIQFSNGSVIAGASEQITFGAHRSDWGVFDQTDDYSYPPSSLAKGAELSTVGFYHGGVLVAGIEP